ncbi:unnamed protein product [Soboliphyme baturini]|uniref:Uncharacterized protein n=1 Tax=Soboliphyme baturini TaxID=241478 RepID=A0A183IQ24_9BILA|nr:unnamed protein product [Soboliphyme baturini]
MNRAGGSPIADPFFRHGLQAERRTKLETGGSAPDTPNKSAWLSGVLQSIQIKDYLPRETEAVENVAGYLYLGSTCLRSDGRQIMSRGVVALASVASKKRFKLWMDSEVGKGTKLRIYRARLLPALFSIQFDKKMRLPYKLLAFSRKCGNLAETSSSSPPPSPSPSSTISPSVWVSIRLSFSQLEMTMVNLWSRDCKGTLKRRINVYEEDRDEKHRLAIRRRSRVFGDELLVPHLAKTLSIILDV